MVRCSIKFALRVDTSYNMTPMLQSVRFIDDQVLRAQFMSKKAAICSPANSSKLAKHPDENRAPSSKRSGWADRFSHFGLDFETAMQILAVMATLSATPGLAVTRPIGSAKLPTVANSDEVLDVLSPEPFARIEPSHGDPQPIHLQLDPTSARVWGLAPGNAASSDPAAQPGSQSLPTLPHENEPGPEEVARLLHLKSADPIIEDVDAAPGEGRIFADLRGLRDQIFSQQRPTASAAVRYSTQSDDLDIRQEEVSQDFYFQHGRSRLGLGLQAINYNPSLLSNINQYAAGINGHHRFNDFSEITGEFRLNRIEGRSLGYYTATFDTYVTLKPSDSFRIDLDVNRRIFDNIISLRRNISATSYGGSVDYTPNNGIRLTARFAGSTFSDGNWRRTEELEGLLRITSSPTLELGLRATNFHFTKLFNNGYFNPRDYYSGEALLRLRAPLNKRLSVDLTGSAGVEDARPGGSKPLIKAACGLSYKVTDRWSLNAEASYFSSRSSSSSGFARTSGFLGIKYHF
jgi:hypothetical protein